MSSQWIECPPGVREVIEDFDIAVIFISFIIYYEDFDIAVPSSKQDLCHTWTQLNGLALHELS